jgi:hypothetical protein
LRETGGRPTAAKRASAAAAAARARRRERPAAAASAPAQRAIRKEAIPRGLRA